MANRENPDFLSASTLKGDKVVNGAGEDIGKIEELMIDLRDGRVGYAVLSFGGFLGMGDKLFAIPWKALQLKLHDHEFLLDISKETLENAEGFDKDNWPITDREWLSTVYGYYGYQPYWQIAAVEQTGVPEETRLERVARAERASSRENPDFLSAGTINGDKVVNRSGDNVGKIEELMIDLQDGKVAYVVVSHGGFLGIGNKLFAVPWQALQLKVHEHKFLLDVPKETLDKEEGFDKDNWPLHRETLSRTYANYGYQPYWQAEAVRPAVVSAGILGETETKRTARTERERQGLVESEQERLARLERERMEAEKLHETEQERLARLEREKVEAGRLRGAESLRAARKEGMVSREGPEFLSASTIKGDKVINTAGEDLGKIEELMIDLDDGRIAYTVLSFGGFLGLGDKLFAIPWNALSLRVHEHAFVLDVPKQVLEKAEGFDKDNWPLASREWLSRTYSYYGYQPYWQREVTERTGLPGEIRSERISGAGGAASKENPEFLSAGTLKGDKVINTAGEDLGKIEEFMIDLDNGRVGYAVLSFGGFLGMADKLFAIPWQALSLRVHEHAFVLDIPKDVLKNAEGFDKDRWPLTRAELYRTYTYYGYQPYWQRETAGITGMPRETEIPPRRVESERMERAEERHGRLKTAEEKMAEQDKERFAEMERTEADQEKKERLERERVIAERREQKYQ